MRALIGGAALLLLSGSGVASEHGELEPAQEALTRLLACRAETAPLARLDCYDHALLPVATITAPEPVTMGPAWRRAMEQEQMRDSHSTAFLLTETAGDNPTVILTTPAIGHPPPRPVLMLSCLDNITRLQVALVAPRREGENQVLLTTEAIRFDAYWFLRESGYLLESSRGLAGIDEIKRLLGAESLTIGLQQGSAGNLKFSIAQLDEAIKPLRSACHW